MKYKTTNEILHDHGSWLEIDVSTNAHPDAVMKIDKADWERVQTLGIGRVNAWRQSPRLIYAQCYWNGKQIRFHRLLIPGAKYIDHANHNGLDNRQQNIRACTNSENQMNKRIRRDNTSGVIGVSYNKEKRKWVAQLRVDGKSIWLGRFPDRAAAIVARKEAEQKYFGEFALQGE